MGPTRSNGRKRLVSDINVTPLVDVMLVLLIIFMVTAPMMTQGIDVDLPEVTAKSLRQEETTVIVTIKKEGDLWINKNPVSRALMIQDLEKLYSTNKDQSININADRNVTYGDVMTVMDDIKKVGFNKVGMITLPPEKE